jgi:hypothetical protein
LAPAYGVEYRRFSHVLLECSQLECSQDVSVGVIVRAIWIVHMWQTAQAQGVYFYEPSRWLIVYTGDSGHDVQIGAVSGFGWVVVLIDSEPYPVYFEDELLYGR